MKKKIFTLMTLALMSIGSAWAQGTYAVMKDDPGVASGTVNTDVTNMKFTWGVTGGKEFKGGNKANNALKEVLGSTAYCEGNGDNGTLTSGTVYFFEPAENGTLTIGFVLNGGKNLFIQSVDGETGTNVAVTSLTDASGAEVKNANGGTFASGDKLTDKLTGGLVTFEVVAGNKYAVYATGTKLGYYGFKYTLPPTETYTVTFDSGSNGTCLIPSLTEESVGTGVTLPAVTANSGYVWTGWFTAASGGSKAGVAGDTYNPTSNITLYAQYAPAIDRSGYNSYYVAEGDEIVSGTQVLCDDITMEYSTADYSAATADGFLSSLNANYVASVTTSTNGWGVTFTPAKSGKLSVGVVINGDKTFSITNVSSFDYYGLQTDPTLGYSVSSGTIASNEWKPAKGYKQYTIITIDVEAGTSYKFSVAGSKLAFYGFEFPQADITNVTITPKNLYTTFCSPFALNFSSVAGLEAYVVSGITASSVELTQVYEVPAGTGLILKQTSDAISYDVPVVASASDPGTNYLKAALVTKTVAADEAYGLKDGKFVKLAASVAPNGIPAGKAYLLASDVSAGAAELTLDFGGATAITNTNRTNDTNNGEIYNLAGQRVAQPTKGLYIVNGKKVIVK